MNFKVMTILNIIYVFLLEFIFKTFVVKTIDFGYLYLIVFSIFMGIVFSIIMSLFKKKVINRIISYFIWFITFIVFCAETIYYSFYKTICGISAIIYGTQVAEFYDSIIEHILDNIWILVGFFVPFIILIILSIKKIKFEKFYSKDSLALFFASFILCLTSLEYNYHEFLGKRLLFKTNDIMETTSTFGLNTAVLSDAIKIFIPFEESLDIEKKDLVILDNKNKEYNVTYIDFEKLIESEKDSSLKNMHVYFQNQIPTEKNSYTSTFAGKNLIFITAEAFSPIAVDKDLTPTLYKLVNNGFIFNNYYQPIYNCSTSDGEFINLLSLLPGVSTCSMKETKDNYYPYNIGTIFKNYGYSSYAFHGWTYNYYSRDKTLPNLGFKYYGYDRYNRGYKYALKGIKDSWPTSDIDVVNSSFDIFSKEKSFITYYMSISGHLQYNFTGGNKIANKNKKAVEKLKANNTIKAYIATQIEFDKSMELLIKKLEEKGILDDTVIVIAADHYPYGLTNKDIKSYVDYVENENFDIYKSNLVIYNPKIKNKVIDKYTSSLDILPTLLNLFGVRYDSRLLMGNDALSDKEGIVILNNKSWITDKGKYDYLKKKFYPFKEDVDQNYIDEINEMVRLKFQMSKLVVSKDYYRKVVK